MSDIETIMRKSARRHRALRDLNRAVLMWSQATTISAHNLNKLSDEKRALYERFCELEKNFAAYRADVEPVLRAAITFVNADRHPDLMNAAKALLYVVDASRVCREIKEGK